MSDSRNAADWRQLQEFAGVDLSKSFALSWRMDSETLVLDADVLLLPDHPFYEKPRPAEKVCIRAAVIEFPYCEAVSHDGEDQDVDSLQHGAIETLRVRDGVYEIVGEFGTVRIDSERPLLRLKGS